MRPARLGPLLVVAAIGNRRDAFAVARDADESCGAGNDLRGDDLAVGTRVGAGETLTERKLVLAAAALNPQVRALLIRIREFELRIEQLIVSDWDIGRTAVPSA